MFEEKLLPDLTLDTPVYPTMLESGQCGRGTCLGLMQMTDYIDHIFKRCLSDWYIKDEKLCSDEEFPCIINISDENLLEMVEVLDGEFHCLTKEQAVNLLVYGDPYREFKELADCLFAEDLIDRELHNLYFPEF